MTTGNSRNNPSSLLDPANASFVSDLLKAYKEDPSQFDQKWHAYLDGLMNDSLGIADTTYADKPLVTFKKRERTTYTIVHNKPTGLSHNTTDNQTLESLRALMMIRAFRVRGHLATMLDPLNIEKPKSHPELDPARYGFDHKNLNNTVILDGVLGFNQTTIQNVLDKLRVIYCQNIGFEFMHIQDAAQKSWLQERIESGLLKPTKEERIDALFEVMQADAFERFLHIKFPGAKRFGLEGGESTMVALNTILTQQALTYGVKELVIGMAHRGRLCTLSHFVKQPLAPLMAQFKGLSIYKDIPEAFFGDVKYHQGATCTRTVKDKQIEVTLLPNPSHLEAVNPVVIGYVRNRQHHLKDQNASLVSGILIHGDAAFAGQGLVAETLELSALDGYETGGTLHIIINNQIGFTTSPPMSRSSPYASDLAKVIQAPVFHINGDDVDAVVSITKLAVDFKQRFKTDVILDIVCYRKNGHNEGDEPMFTQPLMYKAIGQQMSVALGYKDKLIQEKVITEQESDTMKASLMDILNAAFDQSDSFKDPYHQISLEGKITPYDPSHEPMTGVCLKDLIPLIDKAHLAPSNFSVNLKLQRLLDQRRHMLSDDVPFDWGMGEVFAYASLLVEKAHVRLSGQDSGRGTFSHRHAVWTDQMNQEKYCPLNHLTTDQGKFDVIDSPLAEASVLGFEFGYSLGADQTLVMWEGQFGDFANGAQVIIDQFISSSETKWLQTSHLVMLLPHGFEGQGPEHSSARLERYLQLCAHHNWRVVNCTTPANVFHVLRRQVKSSVRKPLIMMTPKSLLRHKSAVSSLKDIDHHTYFQPVLPDPNELFAIAKRHVFCTGKVYYDLIDKREKLGLITENNFVAIHRIEQLYPFPLDMIEGILKETDDAEVIWCQEEPVNMGAFTFIKHRIESVLENLGAKPIVYYAGRSEGASPATGYASRHQFEQESLLIDALVNPPQKMVWH